MSPDFHINPFSEESKTKLLIFQSYLKAWLPVFLARNEIIWKNINIIDFFAGPGFDRDMNEGSPMLIINELKSYLGHIKTSGININLIFNEYSLEKFQKLQENLEKIKTPEQYNIKIENLDFSEAFNNYYKNIKCKTSANLLFLDQSGIKQITKEIFLKIIDCKQTDFIFFISSSTIKRFSKHNSIQKYFDLPVEELQNTPYSRIHKKILEYYKNLIGYKKYYLAPFSIKKGANIYGLIFGSNHILGMEKFLSTVWKIDPERGEANFDIDEENIDQSQLNMFTGNIERPKKVEVFESELRNKIQSKELIDNREIYIYTITQGFLPKHARTVIKLMMKEGIIINSKVNLSYSVYKKSSKRTIIKIG